MNKINSFTDRASRDIVAVTRKIKRTIPPSTAQRRKLFTGRAPICAFTLLEDASSGSTFGTAKARIETIDMESVIVEVADFRYKWGVLDGAKAGYQGDCTKFRNKYYFTQGPCVVKCPSSASFDGVSPTNGKVGTPFNGTATATDADAGSYAASGLPPGLAMDSDGNITGTPTKAGTFWAAVTASGPRSDGKPGSCPITKLVPFTIAK